MNTDPLKLENKSMQPRTTKRVGGIPPDNLRCTSLTKHGVWAGTRCVQWKDAGFDTCRFHGRRTKGVWSAPKTSRRSKKLGKVKAMYDAALNDPNLMDLEQNIALYATRIDEMLPRLANGDVPKFREEALNLYKVYDSAVNTGQDNEADAAFTKLGELLKVGYDRDKAWDAILDKAERQSVRQEKAKEIMVKGEQVVNQRDLMKLLGKMIDIMIEEVPNGVINTLIGRIDTEIMGDFVRGEEGEVGPNGGSTLLQLQEQAGRVHAGDSGEGPVGEAV